MKCLMYKSDCSDIGAQKTLEGVLNTFEYICDEKQGTKLDSSHSHFYFVFLKFIWFVLILVLNGFHLNSSFRATG